MTMQAERSHELPAIAEAAWTPKANKDWQRFAAIVRLTPVL